MLESVLVVFEAYLVVFFPDDDAILTPLSNLARLAAIPAKSGRYTVDVFLAPKTPF